MGRFGRFVDGSVIRARMARKDARVNREIANRESARKAAAQHVSDYIKEELETRGWSLDVLAVLMGGDIGVNRLALEFLMLGASAPDLWVSRDAADQFSKAFDVEPEFFLNLDHAWHASVGKNKVPEWARSAASDEATT